MKSRPRARSSSYWNCRYQDRVGDIVAVGERNDRRQIAVRLPRDAASGDAGVEPERVVLVMRRVDVAPREVWLHDEPCIRRLG